MARFRFNINSNPYLWEHDKPLVQSENSTNVSGQYRLQRGTSNDSFVYFGLYHVTKVHLIFGNVILHIHNKK